MSDQSSCSLPEGSTHPHVERCYQAGRRDMATELTAPVVERQTWERRLGGTDIAEVRIHLEVDAEGRVRIHEALAARLLHEAGWERTA